MKTQQWQLRKATEPRTLADVPSSREKPVLCWVNDIGIGECFCEYGHVHRRKSNGDAVQLSFKIPCDFQLYAQPSRPTKLEDVPDRRVVVAYRDTLTFRENGKWLDLYGDVCCDPGISDWQLTDHCVDLVETEIGVV